MPLDLFASPQIQLPSKRAWFWSRCLDLVPRELEDVITWADTHYRVINNDSEFFKSADSPWLIEPLQMADDPLIASLTFVKPIQTGGTSLGEIILLRRALDSNGQLSYLWPTNDKAKDRWEKWTEKRIRACRPVRAIMPYEYENMLIKYKTGLTFAMQGVFTSGNLDSDTVGIIINEEVHQWQPGMLAKAKGRQTRVDFPKFITISNSGESGGELHTDFNNGTQQHYLNRCPGCGKKHIMRTRWDDARPDLGGLRYDSEGCKRADGTFDYNKLVPTIRYQFPKGSALQYPDNDLCHCGFEMPNDIRLRREACTTEYSEPYNTGALLNNRSYTYQAVACHNIRWLDLIQEKHNALRSLKNGDDSAWRQYLQERESVFYDASEHRPFQGQIVVNSRIVKDRLGIPDRAARLWAADKQKGYRSQGQMSHYWLVIRDVAADATSQLVFEGQVQTDGELIAILDEYKCLHHCGGVDGSWDGKNVMEFCFRNGLNVFLANQSHKGKFLHKRDKTWRYYSDGMESPVFRQLNQTRPKFDYVTNGFDYEPAVEEPLIINYNLAGMLNNYFFLRDQAQNVLHHHPDAAPEQLIRYDIPSDVSEEYQKQIAAWERVPVRQTKTNEEIEGFRKVKKDDHLLMCEAYIAMLMDIGGILGQRLAELGIKPTEDKK
jgi:hypothetical protein